MATGILFAKMDKGGQKYAHRKRRSHSVNDGNAHHPWVKAARTYPQDGQ
jgi:hypothetical protein